MTAIAVAIAGSLMLSTPYGLGSACPISDTLALTAQHVIDPRPFDASVPLQHGDWSDPADPLVLHGSFRPVRTVPGVDLALIAGSFPHHFPIAPAWPRLGDVVTVQGLDWRKRSRILAPRVWRVKIQHVAGRMVSLSENPQEGSSGACVLNELGEVVGISAWSLPSEDNDRAGVAVIIQGLNLTVEETR